MDQLLLYQRFSYADAQVFYRHHAVFFIKLVVQVGTTNPSKTPFLTDNYWKASFSEDGNAGVT